MGCYATVLSWDNRVCCGTVCITGRLALPCHVAHTLTPLIPLSQREKRFFFFSTLASQKKEKKKILGEGRVIRPPRVFRVYCMRAHHLVGLQFGMGLLSCEKGCVRRPEAFFLPSRSASRRRRRRRGASQVRRDARLPRTFTRDKHALLVRAGLAPHPRMRTPLLARGPSSSLWSTTIAKRTRSPRAQISARIQMTKRPRDDASARIAAASKVCALPRPHAHAARTRTHGGNHSPIPRRRPNDPTVSHCVIGGYSSPSDSRLFRFSPANFSALVSNAEGCRDR